MLLDTMSINEIRRPVTRSFAKKQTNLETKCYSKIITNENPTNVISILVNSQITGNAPKTILNVKLIYILKNKLFILNLLFS